MKFIELNKELKSKISSPYNIVGEDVFLISKAIANIKSATIKEFEEFNYMAIGAEKMKSKELEPILLTLPIGNEYRMVILKNPSNELVKFLNQLDFLNMQYLILVTVNAEKFDKSIMIDCTKLDRMDINKYILNYLSKVQLTIEEHAMDYLINATNSNMGKINSELNKLVSYCIDKDVIKLEDTTNLVSNSNEYYIYMLTNAIDKKSYADYQKTLASISKNQSYAEIYSYMGKYFRRMQYIALSKKDDELAKILTIKPYAIKIAREFIAKNGVTYYTNLYQTYVELDHKIKSGKISPINALYKLIF